MRKLIILLAVILMTSMSAFAAKIPDNVKAFVNTVFPNTNFRFDGLIVLPDNTIYLPLMPAQIINPEVLAIKQTIPANKTLLAKPDVVIFTNDFVMLRVIDNAKGQRTVWSGANLPIEIKSGLLPQDLLVPKGLLIPDNMKGIIGNLDIGKAEDTTIKTAGGLNGVNAPKTSFNALQGIPQLQNKTFYIASNYNKNIQVVNQGSNNPEYALLQKQVPINIKAYDDRFLLVTAFNKKSLDVISLQDDKVIKEIEFKTQPDEIVIDSAKKIAYVSSAEDSSIYAVNLQSMTLMKQIKISGMCEKITLSNDGSKLFYFDKQSRAIWVVELDNNYLLRDIGKFPNVSKIAYANNKIYVASRTKNRLAIIDYKTVGLIAEIEICEKPVDMAAYDGNLFILGAGQNVVQTLDLDSDSLVDTIELKTGGFATKIYPVDGTPLAIITDSKAAVYTVFNMAQKKIVKQNQLNIPVNSIVVANRVQKFNK